jgi:3-hydroxyacyl-[acyl-carrier-protein] dehydratase
VTARDGVDGGPSRDRSPTGGPPSEGLASDRLPRPDEVLPHRPPFLFVDEIVELVPGRSARADWRLHGDEPFFAGHFPGRPVLPGVLQVEAIAQCGGLTLWGDERFAGKLGLFGGVERARFRRQVVPGDLVELSFSMERLSARAGKGRGRAEVGGELACEAELFFVIVDAA